MELKGLVTKHQFVLIALFRGKQMTLQWWNGQDQMVDKKLRQLP